MKTYKVTVKGVDHYIVATSGAEAKRLFQNSRFAADITLTEDDKVTVIESSVPENVTGLNIISPATDPNMYTNLGVEVEGGEVTGGGMQGTNELMPGAMGGPGGREGTPTDLFKEFQEQYLPNFMQPFTQARQAIGEAVPGLNIGGGFGRSIANIFANPLANLATVRSMMTGQNQPIAFTGASPFQEATTTFQDLLNQQRIINPQTLEPTNPLLGELQSPQLTEFGGVQRNPFAQEAAKLARAAGRAQYGGLAGRFLPSVDQMLQGFEESPGFGTEGGFLPYLQQRLGLRFE